MTDKQIQAAKKLLNEKHYGDGPYTKDNEIVPWDEKDNILMEELSCRDMINSILIYSGPEACKSGLYRYERYLKPYTVNAGWHKGLISVERLAELIEEQKADFAKAKTGWCDFTDSEGGSYKYCQWADEQ